MPIRTCPIRRPLMSHSTDHKDPSASAGGSFFCATMVARPGRRLVGVFEVDGTIRQNCEPGRIHSYRDDRSHVPVRDHDTVL